jgi:hypothetical protein
MASDSNDYRAGEISIHASSGVLRNKSLRNTITRYLLLLAGRGQGQVCVDEYQDLEYQ